MEVEEKRIAKDAADKVIRESVGKRQLFVEELEREYLGKGFDVHLSATGPYKTFFTRGFKKAAFTDGYSGGWTIEVN